jgi:hypothetical protein
LSNSIIIPTQRQKFANFFTAAPKKICVQICVQLLLAIVSSGSCRSLVGESGWRAIHQERGNVATIKQASKQDTNTRERERERESLLCFALLCICGFVVVVVVVTVFCALLCFVLHEVFLIKRNQEFPRCSHPVLKMFPTFPMCSQRCFHIVWPVISYLSSLAKTSYYTFVLTNPM